MSVTPDQLLVEIAERLGRVESRGHDRQGQQFVKTLCPAHADRKASLSVTAGQKRIRLHCFAGCAEEDVIAALGLDKQALFYEPARRPDDASDLRPTQKAVTPPQPKKKAVAQAQQRKTEHVVKTFFVKGLGKPVHEYTYTRDGELLYVVAKYVDSEGSKEFRQFVPAPAGGWYRRGVPPEERVLYNCDSLPGRDRIYLVEGEKDADNAPSSAVFVSASNGANAPWQPQYSAALAGKRVTIIADNDEPGLAYARRVRAELQRAGVTANVVTPTHGKDWTDHQAAGGTLETLVPLDEQEETSEDVPPPAEPPSDLPPHGNDESPRRRKHIGPQYRVDDGQIWRVSLKQENGRLVEEWNLVLGCIVELVESVRVVSGDATIDDQAGGMVTKHVLRATHRDGRTDTLRPGDREFCDGSWLSSLWPDVAYRSHRSARNEIVDAIRATSHNARRISAFSSTGWQDVDGQRAFVHSGGAITSQGVISVHTDYPRALRIMCLPEPTSDVEAAAAESIGLITTEWLVPRIGLVLAGAAYRAILPNQAVVPLFVAPPESAKTSVSIIGAQHFAPELNYGDKQYVSMSSAGATPKAAQQITHMAKDVLLIVDDYPPQTGREQDGSQSVMIRMAYDRASRDNLTRERTFRDGPAPRCLVMTSAEYAPSDIGARQRALMIPMPWGTNPPLAEIVEAQSRAKAKARAAFMAWLIQQTAAHTPENLRDWVQQTEFQCQQEFAQTTDVRTAEHVAKIVTGWIWALNCLVDAKVWSESKRDEFLAQHVWPAAHEAIRANADPDSDATPVDRFLRLVREAVGRRAYVADARKPNQPPEGMDPLGCGWEVIPNGGYRPSSGAMLVGWVKDSRLWLHPGPCLKVAEDGAITEGVTLQAKSDSAASQLLDAAGLIEVDKGRRTRQVRIAGKQTRVWDLHVSNFWSDDDAPTPPASPESPSIDPESPPESPIVPPATPTTPGRVQRHTAASTAHLSDEELGALLNESWGDPQAVDDICFIFDERQRADEEKAGKQPPSKSAARTERRWRAAEAVITLEHAILSDGSKLPAPSGHAGNLVEWADANHIGSGGGRSLPEGGHLWLSSDVLEENQLPLYMEDSEQQSQSLATARKSSAFWQDAEADGWDMGDSRPGSGWIGIQRQVAGKSKQKAIVTSLDWMNLQALARHGEVTPVQLARRLGLWTTAFGLPLSINEGVTWRGVSPINGIHLPELDWHKLAADFKWCRTLAEDERQSARFIHAYDRRKSYLAAAGAIHAGTHLEHVSNPTPDPRKWGFWRVTKSTWNLPLPSPHECYDGEQYEWVATPLLAVLMDEGPVECAEAWLYPQTTQVLAPAYKRTKMALEVAEGWPADDDTRAVVNALKASYRAGVGMLAQVRNMGEQNRAGHRPDIRALVIACHRANSLRAVRHAGKITDEAPRNAWPLAMARSDAVIFASDDPDPMSAWCGRQRDVSQALGKYKSSGTTTLSEWESLMEGHEDNPARAVFAVSSPEKLLKERVYA